MVDLGGMADSLVSKASELGKDFSLLTGAAGFLYGADAKWLPSNVGSSYPFNSQGIADAIAQVFGKGTAAIIFPNNVSSVTADKTFNLGAVFNKGTGVAALLYLLKEVAPGRYTKLLYNLGFAPALGYGIGRIFDDPPGSTLVASGPLSTFGSMSSAKSGWN